MRKGDNLANARYCGLDYNEGDPEGKPHLRGMNWHGAELGRTGRFFRCMCSPQFRLPDGTFGPNGYTRKKAFMLTKPKNRFFGFKWRARISR